MYPAHILIVNMKRHEKGAITAINHQHAMVTMALAYHEMFINAAYMVENRVIDIE